MRTAVAAGVTGLLAATGAVVGFQQMAPTARAESTAHAADAGAVAVHPVVEKKHRPRVVERLKPCPHGFTLTKRTCVRDVERTVVVDVAAAPTTPAAPPPQPVSQPVPQSTSGGEQGDDQGEPGDGVDQGDGSGGDGAEAGEAGEAGEGDHGDHGNEDQPGNVGDHEDEPEDG